MMYAAPEESSTVSSNSVKRWESLSFTSTLYLRPILDALLEPTPALLHDELRLGLQEALVNAAKHGNHLDPQKVVSVRHARANGYYWWIVTDQGEGFKQPANYPLSCPCPSPDSALVSDCGRGLYILHQVFDQVRWSENGKEIHLANQLRPAPLKVLMSPASFIRVIESWWRRWSPKSVQSSI